MAQDSVVTSVHVRERKGGTPLTMMTAYDFPTAQLVEQAGIDLVLVGDSLGMVVLGLENTLGVTLEMMAHHTRAVARACKRTMVVADMPFLSYHVSLERSVENAGELVRAGAAAVKLEGGRKRVPVVAALVAAEIPVMGHIGLTPQSIHALGGYRVQGRIEREARRLVDEAVALEQAGVFALVIECVPEDVGRAITEAVQIPTIGIGAGVDCDGQVLVFHDLLGLGSYGRTPRFVRRYADLGKQAVDALRNFVADVQRRDYPGPSESYQALVDPAAQREHD